MSPCGTSLRSSLVSLGAIWGTWREDCLFGHGGQQVDGLGSLARMGALYLWTSQAASTNST